MMTTVYTVTNHLTGEAKRFYLSESAATYCAEHLSDERYDEFLDEVNEPVQILGLTYAPSVALFRVDEIAYHVGKNDWADNEYCDLVYELDRLDYNDSMDWYDFTITTRSYEE